MRFEWAALMRAGMSGRGLTPDQFWRLTPAELLMMLGRGGGGPAPMGRRRLAELAAAFPDKAGETDGG